jgi:predicted exporter
MAAIAYALSHAFSRAFQSAGEIDTLKQIAVFCAAGLLVALLCSAYGLDLSPGFF